MTDIATASGDGYTVVSNNETTEQLTAAIAEPEEESSPTASEIGRKGGEAAAAVRRANARAAKRAGEADDPEVASPGDPAVEETSRDDTDGSDEIPEKETDKPLGKPRDDPKARMLEATRKEAEAKRETKAAKERADALEKELQALKAPKPAETTPKPAVKADDATKPKAENFETHEEWVEALADWKLEAKLKEREELTARKVREEAETKYLNETVDKAMLARKEYAKTDPKWFDRVSQTVKDVIYQPSIRNPTAPVVADNVIADEILLIDRDDPSKALGPRLMLHFTEDPEDFERMRALKTWQDVQVEMRMLARSLEKDASPVSKRVEVSNARPPVRPVTGMARVPDDAPDSESSYDAHREFWNKRDKRARA